jgi:hypothetical protein
MPGRLGDKKDKQATGTQASIEGKGRRIGMELKNTPRPNLTNMQLLWQLEDL